jgi:hypothetical protein
VAWAGVFPSDALSLMVEALSLMVDVLLNQFDFLCRG